MRQRYIQSFNTAENVQAAIDDKLLGKPYVALIHDGAYIDWNSKEIDYANMYLTIKARANGNLTVNLSCSYSKNGGDWTSISPKTTISIASGDEIRFKGNLDNSANGMFSGNTLSSNIYGNVLSLKYGDSFKGKNSSYDLKQMFYNYSGLKDAGNLFLPTLLQNSCYEKMFYGCSSLTTAPALPATTLVDDCYMDMFHGCTSLTIAPVLPATTLAQRCYRGMFWSCTSLAKAPTLPATTLVNSCYSNMFNGCTSLTTAPELPTTTLAEGCYRGMFQGCTSLTTAPALPAEDLVQSCYNSMFRACTSLTSAPALPATILQVSCYAGMFSGCTNLNYIKCLATNISAFSCTANWVNGVSSTGTFVKDPNPTWGRGPNRIPDGWTVIDAE